MVENVAVIGAGSWGTTVAALAAGNAPTVLWARDPELAATMDREHRNPRYLAEHACPRGSGPPADLAEAVAGADLVLMAVPSHGFRGGGRRAGPVAAPRACPWSA